MFDIEKMKEKFDYSVLDNETADFLRSCEYEMNGIAEDARIKLGQVLSKAHDKGMGTFIVDLDSDEEVVAPSVDELLEELFDAQELIDLVGDEDGEYQRRIDVIKDQLLDMTDEGGNSNDR